MIYAAFVLLGILLCFNVLLTITFWVGIKKALEVVKEFHSHKDLITKVVNANGINVDAALKELNDRISKINVGGFLTKRVQETNNFNG